MLSTGTHNELEMLSDYAFPAPRAHRNADPPSRDLAYLQALGWEYDSHRHSRAWQYGKHWRVRWSPSGTGDYWWYVECDIRGVKVTLTVVPGKLPEVLESVWWLTVSDAGSTRTPLPAVMQRRSRP